MEKTNKLFRFYSDIMLRGPEDAPFQIFTFGIRKGDYIVHKWTKRGKDTCITQFWVKNGVNAVCDETNTNCSVKKALLVMNYCHGKNGDIYFPLTTSKHELEMDKIENVVGLKYRDVGYERGLHLRDKNLPNDKERLLKYVKSLIQ